MTTRAQIAAWYDTGVQLDATHMLVVDDTFEHEDYVVYVRIDPTVEMEHRQGRVIVVPDISDLRALIALRYDKVNAQTLMEVYNLTMDRDEQLATPRVFNY